MQFTILYININSIQNKIEKIESLIKIAEGKNSIVHFIALAEIKLEKEQNKYYNIENYNAYFNNRIDGDGGVAL